MRENFCVFCFKYIMCLSFDVNTIKPEQTTHTMCESNGGGSGDCCTMHHHYTTQHHRQSVWPIFCYCYRLLCIIMWSSEWRQYCILDSTIDSGAVVVHIRVQWMIFSFSFSIVVHWKLEKAQIFRIPFFSLYNRVEWIPFSHSSICIIVFSIRNSSSIQTPQ